MSDNMHLPKMTISFLERLGVRLTQQNRVKTAHLWIKVIICFQCYQSLRIGQLKLYTQLLAFISDPEGKFYFPCGAIANSMFNDTIQLYIQHEQMGPVPILQERRGIAWPTDLKRRYKNPKEFSDENHTIWKHFTKPRDWSRTIWDLDPTDPENNGVQNEDFVVWMRTAAFSNFQKLYRIIRPSAQKDILGDDDTLPAGKYLLEINYSKQTY